MLWGTPVPTCPVTVMAPTSQDWQASSKSTTPQLVPLCEKRHRSNHNFGSDFNRAVSEQEATVKVPSALAFVHVTSLLFWLVTGKDSKPSLKNSIFFAPWNSKPLPWPLSITRCAFPPANDQSSRDPVMTSEKDHEKFKKKSQNMKTPLGGESRDDFFNRQGNKGLLFLVIMS